MNLLLPLAEVAERMGYKAPRSLCARARRGDLPFEILRDGGRLVVRAEDLHAHLTGLPRAHAPGAEDQETESIIASVLARMPEGGAHEALEGTPHNQAAAPGVNICRQSPGSRRRERGSRREGLALSPPLP